MPELASAAVVALSLISFVVLIYAIWFLRNRRLRAQDRQRLSLSARKFHVCLLFRVPNGSRIDETARNFVHKILGGGDAHLVYAGQVAFSIDASQLGPARWDGLLLFEFESRERFNAAYTERFRRARTAFSESYLHGLQRQPVANGLSPLLQLWLLVSHLARGRLREEPLRYLPELNALPEHDAIRGYLRRLDAVHQIAGDSLVVYNLARRKRELQPSYDNDYTNSLLTRLARKGMGPLHVGSFARIEHNAVFDSVYVVQYPSARYFGDLLRSQYHRTIANHHLLADGLIIPTVPITHRL